MPEKRKLIDPLEIGSKGGHARARNLSAEERSNAARLAGAARWKVYYAGKVEQKKSRRWPDIQIRKMIDPVASGSKGGHARARNLSPEERQKGARLAIAARWKAYYDANPEKWKARQARAKRHITETTVQAEADTGYRQYVVTWLTKWRKQNGIGESGRPLSNRSLSQLQRMFEQAQSGERSYRSGRRWGATQLPN